jgi:hypothetical protein
MAILDFLRPKGNGKTPTTAQRRGQLDAAVAQIGVDRAAARLVLDGIEQRRADLLKADAPASEILKLDEEGDLARIRLEKLDCFEIEVQAALSEVEGVEAEAEWRQLSDRRHAAACDYASAFNECCERLGELRHLAGAANVTDIVRRSPGLMSEPPPFVLSGELLQRFLRETERVADAEERRRAAVDRRNNV